MGFGPPPGDALADVRPADPESPGALALLSRALVVFTTAAIHLVPAGLTAACLVLVGRRDAAQRHLSRRLVALLERLGPAFIKGGQILGTRRDLLPRALCDSLAGLQDSVAPLPPDAARTALAAAYGPRVDELFAYVDYRAVASGSVASVYRGRLINGRDVAIKLQRPGIEAVMAADLTLIKRGGALMARTPPFRGVPVEAVLEHVCDAVQAQLDFQSEAASLQRLRENLASVPRVWVPSVVREASCARAIVMEFIPGLDKTSADRCSASVRKRFAGNLLAAVYRMLFVDGFVHCDMHPGNLYFTPRGQVVVLDAGFTVMLPDNIRRLFAEFFLNMAIGRGRRCAEIVVESATGTSADADVEQFKSHLADLVERNSGIPAKEFSLISFATELFDLQRRFGLHAATEMVFPLLSLLVIEGTVRDLDADVDFQAAARPVLMEGVFSDAALSN